jgi:uncharacterized cupin superfamily protein
VNLRDCAVEELDELPAGFRHLSARVRPAIGGVQIGCSIYELPQGEQLWPYHWHLGNEEWAIVVDGTPTLRTPAGERELRTGDIVGFVQGEAGAHTFVNRSNASVRIALFSTLRPGQAFYPESGKVGSGPPSDRRYFRLADAVEYWDGEV